MTHLALFDLDHTLIPTDSDHEWGRFMVKLGIVDSERFMRDVDRFYADYKAGQLDIHAYLEAMLTPLAKYSREQLAAWHEQFMHEVIRPALVPVALELVRSHQDKGDLCCIVTATNVFVTAPIGKALGFEHLLGIELGTEGGDPLARFTGASVGIPTFREGKITRTENWLASLGHCLQDFPQSWFYSDSINDVPLLERVTHPVATNPDARLRAIANERGWPVIELFA